MRTPEENRRWRNYQAQQRRLRQPKISVPPLDALRHRLLIEAQGPGLTINDDGEFSSRGLTDWYVSEYARLNSLKV